MYECTEKPETNQEKEKKNITKTFSLVKKAHLKLELRDKWFLKIFSPLKRSQTISIGQH